MVSLYLGQYISHYITWTRNWTWTPNQ